MNIHEAYKTLDLAKGLGMERVEEQFAKLRSEMRERITSTSNEKLLNVYKNRLEQLEEAYVILSAFNQRAQETNYEASPPINSIEQLIPESNRGKQTMLVVTLVLVVVIFGGVIIFLTQEESTQSTQKESSREVVSVAIDKELTNPLFIQNNTDITFTDVPLWNNKAIEKINQYIQRPDLLINNESYQLLGWSDDGFKVAFIQNSSSCSAGFCDDIESSLIYDVTTDKVIEEIKYVTGNDGMDYDEAHSHNMLQITRRVRIEFLTLMKKYRIIPLVNNSNFVQGNKIDWNGLYTIAADGDVLYITSENEYGQQVRKKVATIKGLSEQMDLDELSILGFYKSPMHKRIVVLIETSFLGASGRDSNYLLFGSLLKNRDFEVF